MLLSDLEHISTGGVQLSELVIEDGRDDEAAGGDPVSLLTNGAKRS